MNTARERQERDPAMAPHRFASQSEAWGGPVVQQLLRGRDVAPLGADLQVPRAMPVGLHIVVRGMAAALPPERRRAAA